MRPNRHTIGLIAVLLAMGYAGASQNNAAAYLLAFLTFGVAAVSALHGWMNLRKLTLSAEPITPTYEEEPIALCVIGRAAPGRRHTAIQLAARGSKNAATLVKIDSETAARVELLAPPLPRGRYHGIEILAQSTYPLGFFTATAVLRLPQEFYVYPKPAGALPLPVEVHAARQAQVGMRAEGDDFAGVREWNPGQSMRHVDWKAVARGQRLMVKQWSGTAMDPFLFEWEKLPNLAFEDRLRQLARWLVLAERHDSPYGLKLPSVDIPLSRGDAHFHRCMRALADFRPPA